MKQYMIRMLVTTLLILLCANALAARKDDLDIERLTTSLNRLDNDPVLGAYARAERALARVALQQLKDASSRERPHALYLAERSVDQARAAAQLQDAQQQLNQLDREHDQILLRASREDAKATRRELERQRLQNQLAAEEAQRLQAQGQAYSEAAEQARKLAAAQTHSAALARKQASLATAAAKALRARMEGMTVHQGNRGRQMTVTGDAFATGQASLRPEARQHLGKLIRFAKSQPGNSIRIEGYTDATGSSSSNKALSLQRAQAVRNALIAAGVHVSRMTTVGRGEADPVASNATASGRAMNRRVVVILRDK